MGAGSPYVLLRSYFTVKVIDRLVLHNVIV